VKLAARNGAKLKVMDVISDMPNFLRNLVPMTDGQLSAILTKRWNQLDALVASVVPDRLDVECNVVFGRPFVELIGEVIKGECDVLIKDAHADSNDLFFGSLDLRLLRYCPVPVWLVKPTVPHEYDRVVAAIDPIVDDTGQRTNEAITNLAMSICDRVGAELSIVSVWRKPWDALEANDEYPETLEANDEYRETYDELTGHIESAAKETLQRTLRNTGANVPPERIEFMQGLPSDIIVEAVDSIGADLLVMGTLGRSGVAGLVLGNTAENVLRQVRCSVLTIKPEGFVSPLLSELDQNLYRTAEM